MVAHALSPRVPAPARLRALVSALRGRFAVTNHPRVVRLPNGLATALRALVRAGIDESVLTNAEGESPGRHAPTYDRARRQRERDPQTAFARRMGLGLLSTFPPTARNELARGVTWVALALYESAAPTVRLDPAASPRCRLGEGRCNDRGRLSPHPRRGIEDATRLACATRHGRRRTRDCLAASSAPTTPRWRDGTAGGTSGVVRRSAPRARLVAPEHADNATLAHWARLTGRSGEPDRYWFPETWDRFLEPGRRVGWLTASDVWRPRRGRLATSTDASDGAERCGGAAHPPSWPSPRISSAGSACRRAMHWSSARDAVRSASSSMASPVR